MLDLIPTESLPNARRTKLRKQREERRLVRNRAICSACWTFLLGFLSLAYGAISAFAWIGGANPLFGIVAAIISGGMACFTIGSAAVTSAEMECFRASVPAPRLLAEAEAERTLEAYAHQYNAAASSWNEAAGIAEGNDVGERSLRLQSSQRAELEACRRIFDDRLARYRRNV